MLPLKSLVRPALATAFLLLLPLGAMQFTPGVTWDLADFVIAGALLFGTGLAYELVARRGGSSAYRMAIGLALATGLLLVWMNLAVGLIGSEDNPANLLYGGVLAVGVIGTLLARFQARGMVRALLATALAQAVVPVLALLIWQPLVGSGQAGWGIAGVLGVNALFVALWVGAALLFRRASASGLNENQRLAQ